MVEAEPTPLVLKTLEELKQENEVVRTLMEKQDDMFKEHAQTNTNMKDCFKSFYQDCHP